MKVLLFIYSAGRSEFYRCLIIHSGNLMFMVMEVKDFKIKEHLAVVSLLHRMMERMWSMCVCVLVCVSVCVWERERARGRETERERHTGTEKNRKTATQTDSKRESERDTETMRNERGRCSFYNKATLDCLSVVPLFPWSQVSCAVSPPKTITLKIKFTAHYFAEAHLSHTSQ